MLHRISWLATLVTLLGMVTALPRAGATAPTGSRPWIHNGQTVPVYSYAHAIHQTVYVRSSVDSDHDGARDRLALDIIRPAEAAAAHLKVPVILDASPYYACCGRGNEDETKTYERNGAIAKMPLFYDNYFVPRGYAVAELDLPGTARSTGCVDMGGPDEIAGAKAAIDWLNGRAKAFNRNGHAVRATWTNGKVGLIGKSWDGSVANGVAGTGVAGLKTVVAISAISSWYDYVRVGGVVRLKNYVHDIAAGVGNNPHRCRTETAAAQRASADHTGNFNQFWRARDFRLRAQHVKAAMFVVHGLNDLNVTTNQFSSWWQQLSDAHVTRKLWLSQTGHVDPFDYRRKQWVHTLHEWFDHWLQGLHNNVLHPQVSVERPSGKWVTEPRWPLASGSTSVRLGAPGSANQTIVDHPNLTEQQAVAHLDRHRSGRAAFLASPTPNAQDLSGVPKVQLRLRLNRPTSEITVRLVQVGRMRRVDYNSAGAGIETLHKQSCWGQSTAIDDACYLNTRQVFITSRIDVLSRGWLDAAHRRSLSHPTPLRRGHWCTIHIRLTPVDTVVPQGARLGVVVSLSDRIDTEPATTGATAVIDPARSVLRLPVATGPGR